MKRLFWLTLAHFGFWIPCKKFMPPKGLYDWVLISWYENGLTYRYLPKIAEYSYTRHRWHTEDEVDEDFLNSCNITHWRRIPEFRKLKML